MKALNEKEVVKSHIKFAAHLSVLIVLTLFFIHTFLKTSEAEITEIKSKTSDCEKIFSMQTELCDDIDEFFTRYRAFDARDDVNAEFLMRSIVDRKMEITKKISQLPTNDVKIHSFMMTKMDGFLRVRDSISVMKKEENRVKEDLFMCNGDYRKLNKQKRTNQFLK